MATRTITTTDTLNEIVEKYPDTLPVLHQFGFDTCCGGTTPLAIAAERHEVDLQTLVHALTAEQPNEQAR